MDSFVDPRLADHAQGLELRIIEITERIERVRRWPAAGRLVTRLEAERRELYDELAETTARTARHQVRPVTVSARRVSDAPGQAGGSRRTA